MAWLGFGATCGLALCGLWALADRLRTHPTPLRNADRTRIGLAAAMLILAAAAIAAIAVLVMISNFA